MASTMPALADDTPTITLDNLLASPRGPDLLTCIQCGTCAGTCPYGDVMALPAAAPHRHAARGLHRGGHRQRRPAQLRHLLRLQGEVPARAAAHRRPAAPGQGAGAAPASGGAGRAAEGPRPTRMRYGNPMGESPRKRAAWVATAPACRCRSWRADPRPVDVLWFVECYTSYYPRGQDNGRATAKLFGALGVDFAILGNEEKCAGECARLAGETGLFDTLTEQNMATFGKYEFGSLVTSGPHAFDAFTYRVPGAGLRPAGGAHHAVPARRVSTRSSPASRASSGYSGHLPRLLRARPAQPHARRAAAAPRGAPRREAGGDDPQPRQHDLLRRRRRAGCGSTPTTRRKGQERLSDRRVEGGRRHRRRRAGRVLPVRGVPIRGLAEGARLRRTDGGPRRDGAGRRGPGEVRRPA